MSGEISLTVQYNNVDSDDVQDAINSVPDRVTICVPTETYFRDMDLYDSLAENAGLRGVAFAIVLD